MIFKIMITVKDLKALEFIAYMADELYPALEKRMNRGAFAPYWLRDMEYSKERVQADLRKIRRLALNISKHIED